MMVEKQIYSFESEVYSIIKACCSENEFVDLGHSAQDRLFDIWLPYGCPRLNIHDGTAIEIKYNLLFDTIDRLKLLYKHSLIRDIREIIVVTNNSESLNSLYPENFSNGINIRLLSISELRKMAEHALGESMDSIVYKSDILEDARKAFNNNRVTLFIGAGVSKDAKLVDWEQLQKLLLSDKRNESNIQIQEVQKVCRNSDIISGRYIKSIITNFDCWHSGKRFDNKIKEVLYVSGHQHSYLIDAITTIIQQKNVESIITYNYDDLLEQELEVKAFVETRSIFEGNRTSKFEKPIYHIHGYAPEGEKSCSKLVFSEEDYHEQYKNSFLWSNIEQLHALNRNTCFFIGLSMLDPNLRRLLDFSINSYPNESSAPHFAFMKRNDGVSEAIDKQTTKVLMDLGVNAIWFDDFPDLPEMILKLIK